MRLTIQRQSQAVNNPKSEALYIEYRDTEYHLSELAAPSYHYIDATIVKAKQALIPHAVPEVVPGYYVHNYRIDYFEEKEQFERTHQLIEDFSFSIALEALKSGMKVARKSWKNHSYAHEPQYLSMKENISYENEFIKTAIYVTLVSGIEIPFIPHMKELLADDWCIYEL